ncbi:3-hydroxyisobutyrate dehydrogenase [Motilibacter rhizosphaerae]|uniref:3-hydroxyisobutyrate dehydrogenase n=1 Tax=Motilibacter rhizosphaerae TaxID=598652 RepID=A0A4Q7NVI9_9ACTN|nr:NAD(P)-dependent oxidoreductase [Motilibacter rhizosphaerae]RZS90888.1 3-hydroxyisobutyrate dehydrogenase [Motilibacter rhizosphaerae]
MTTTAILGAGLMGAAMAARLAEQGHDVRLWNRTADKARAAAGDGVTAVESLADALAGAQVAITMLRDGDAVEEVVRAALPQLRDGRVVWVQASTVGVEAADRLRGLADDAGVAVLDAPVSGSTSPARQGSLTWLVGGPAAAVEQARPVLDDLGTVVHVGVGQEGSRLKLLLNLWMASATVAMADALSGADALGVPRDALLGVLDGGPLGMPYALLKAGMMGEHAYPAGFPVDLALKDVRLALDALGSAPLARVVEERLAAASEQGHGRDDLAAVAEV